MRYALAAALLLTASTAFAQEEMSDGWWVVVGTLAQDKDLGHGGMTSDRFFNAADHCGVTTSVVKSRQFEAMKPGYTVVVAGPFETELKGRAILAQAKVCVSDAYLLRSTFSGE